MTEREKGYQHGIADAEKVCNMMAASWTEKARLASVEQRKIAELFVDTLKLAAKSIRDLEPGIMSPKE